MPAPAAIHDLVERFDRNLDAYRSGQYNETQARREFIDPFFEALGWDVNNRQGYAEAYKDVIHEDAIKIGGATKAPDYCFRIGGDAQVLRGSQETLGQAARRHQRGVPAPPLCLVGQAAAEPPHRLRRICDLRLPVRPDLRGFRKPRRSSLTATASTPSSEPAVHPHPDDEGVGAAGGGILQARLCGRGQGQL